jgi:hypothetical protein
MESDGSGGVLTITMQYTWGSYELTFYMSTFSSLPLKQLVPKSGGGGV